MSDKIDDGVIVGGYSEGFSLPNGPRKVEMTLRDYFAAAALQGLLGNHMIYEPAFSTLDSIQSIAKDAYLFSNAMLRERAKHGAD